MKPLSHIALLAIFGSPFLAACSSPTATENLQLPQLPTIEATAAPSVEPVNLSSAPIDVAPQLMTDWPADTPNLRDVVFEFKVTGDREHIMPDDGSGFLIIRSEGMAEPVKLVFNDGLTASYRMPIDRFEILSVGPSLTCRETAFSVPSNDEAGMKISVEIEGGSFSGRESQWAYTKLSWHGAEGQPGESSSVNKFCRNDAAWAEFDGIASGSDPSAKENSAGGGKGGTTKKVVEGVAMVVGTVAMIALCAATSFTACLF